MKLKITWAEFVDFAVEGIRSNFDVMDGEEPTFIDLNGFNCHDDNKFPPKHVEIDIE